MLNSSKRHEILVYIFALAWGIWLAYIGAMGAVTFSHLTTCRELFQEKINNGWVPLGTENTRLFPDPQCTLQSPAGAVETYHPFPMFYVFMLVGLLGMITVLTLSFTRVIQQRTHPSRTVAWIGISLAGVVIAHSMTELIAVSSEAGTRLVIFPIFGYLIIITFAATSIWMFLKWSTSATSSV